MGNNDDFESSADAASNQNQRRSSRRRSNPHNNLNEFRSNRRPSNSSFNADYGSQRRPSAPSTSWSHGHYKPPIYPSYVRDGRKRSGGGLQVQLMRPLSREHGISADNVSTANIGLIVTKDLRMLTVMDSHSSVGSANQNDSNRHALNNERTRHDHLREHTKNRTNLELNRTLKYEDQLSGEPHKMSSSSSDVQSKKQNVTEHKVEGRRIQYDRNFLLQLQFEPESLQRPASLPSLPEIIIDGPVVKNERSTLFPIQRNKNVNDFIPSFAQHQQQQQQQQHHQHPTTGLIIRAPAMASTIQRIPAMFCPVRTPVRRIVHQKEPQRKVIQVSLQQNVQLHTTENAWKPTAKKESAIRELNEDLYRKVRGILNKLTPQKFLTLIQQVYDLEINTEEKLKSCIDLIFEKAVSEPSFSVAYANMAKCLIVLKVPTEENPEEMITFRKLLLNKCQREFEKDTLEEFDLEQMQALIDEAESEEKKKQLIGEKEEAERKAKRRSLGNMRFIGELYKLKMLTENIMHDCIVRLLRSSNDEDNLECLCRLMKTIGQDIDNDKSRAKVDQYSNQLKKIINTRKISSRIKFMLQDLLELRENSWVPRHEDNKPKMIEQIHKEAEQEEQQKQMILMQRSSQECQKGGGGGLRRPRTPGGSTSEEGWRTSSHIVDPSRMKLTKHEVDENIKLGPRGRPGYCPWQRGSSGGTTGSRTPSIEREKPPRHSTPTENNYDHRNYSRSSVVPRSKGLAMRSMERDRNAAIAAVRSLASVNPIVESRTLTPTNSRNASRDSSCNREFSRCTSQGSSEIKAINNGSCDVRVMSHDSCEDKVTEAIKTLKTSSEPTTDELMKKTKDIMEEFLQIYDLQEASACISELHSCRAVTSFISAAINFVLERSTDERFKTGQLLVHLVKQRVVSLDQCLTGLKEVVKYGEDMEIDIPKIWQYFGELIGSMVVDKTTISIHILLKQVSELMTNPDKTSELIAKVLDVTSASLGRQAVCELWSDSKLSLTDFLPPKKVEEFIKIRKLQWLQPNDQTFNVNRFQADLIKEIPTSSNKEIINFVDTRVDSSDVKKPQFIRAMMTAICSFAIKDHSGVYKIDQEVIKCRSSLLSKYLDHNVSLEVEALYALQNVVHKLQHPPSVLRICFDTLYDEDIISEEAFNQWYNKKNDYNVADEQGKGIAKNSVVQFFSWLHEAEEQ